MPSASPPMENSLGIMGPSSSGSGQFDMRHGTLFVSLDELLMRCHLRMKSKSGKESYESWAAAVAKTDRKPMDFGIRSCSFLEIVWQPNSSGVNRPPTGVLPFKAL